MNDKTLQSLENVRTFLTGNWTQGKEAHDDSDLPDSMTDYSASAEVFDGLIWASGSMNLSIRFMITKPMVKARKAAVVDFAANGTLWGPIGVENRVISCLRTMQVIGVSIPDRTVIGFTGRRQQYLG